VLNAPSDPKAPSYMGGVLFGKTVLMGYRAVFFKRIDFFIILPFS